jgi:hypothetical protein
MLLRTKYKGIIKYRILKCYYYSIETYEIPPQESIEDLLSYFYNLLWNYKLCKECYKIVPDRFCFECTSMQVFWEWGKLKFDAEIPQCSICLEDVYHSKLECGHYFHKTCLIKLNPLNWYHSKEIKCPNFRKVISEKDVANYFLAEV